MALSLGPRTLGEVVELRGPRGGRLTVVAPDGLMVIIPAENGRASVWLAQVGEWSYAWEDQSGGRLTVEAHEEITEATPGLIEGG